MKQRDGLLPSNDGASRIWRLHKEAMGLTRRMAAGVVCARWGRSLLPTSGLRLSNGSPIDLEPIESSRFHIFLSHRQLNGQDQVAALASVMRSLVPGVRIFLDVESSDEFDLEEFGLSTVVCRSQNFLLFMTEGVFKSKFVLEEIHAAIRYNR